MIYATGHVKRNPDGDEVAIRTIFNEADGPQFAAAAWLIAAANGGPRSAKTEDLAGWVDLYIPVIEEQGS